MTANTSGMTTATHAVVCLRICVTGGIACGKSLVGAHLKSLGVAVIEADAVCHDLMRAGRPLFPRIVAAFGREIVAPDGEINRVLLGRRVFGDAPALSRLNAIMHPAAREAIAAWVRARQAEFRLDRQELRGNQQFCSGGAAVIRNPQSAIRNSARGWRGGAAVVIPLLYETGWEAAWDRVICVSAPPALQRKRLRAKGWTEKEAHERMAAQWPVEEKMKRADYVVFNAGTRVCARRQTVRIMQYIGEHLENDDGR